MAFRVGQKVVYVGRGGTNCDEPRLVRGRIYTVSRSYVVFCFDESCSIPAIELFEVDAPATDEFHAGYAAADFRPIVEHKTDISIFKKMLAPKALEARELCPFV